MIYQLKENIRDEMAEIMLKALRQAGVVLTPNEHYELKEALMYALIGKVTL